MTWWFRISATLFVLGVIMTFFYLRTRTIQLANKMLEEKVRVRTAELLKSKKDLESYCGSGLEKR